MNINLEDYKISYEVTVLPNVLYAELVNAKTPLVFDSFYIPEELKNFALECRFILYDKDGGCVEFSNNITLEQQIVYTLNLVPLKMIHKLCSSVKNQYSKEYPVIAGSDSIADSSTLSSNDST
jgi:hypothetical protein